MASWTSLTVTTADGVSRLDAEFWVDPQPAPPAGSADVLERLEALSDRLAKLTAEAHRLERRIEAGRGGWGHPKQDGWPARPFEDLCQIHVGCDISSRDCQSDPADAYQVFRGGGIAVGGGLCRSGLKRFIRKDKCRGLEKFVLRKNDIVMCLTEMGTAEARQALLGYSALIDQDGAYILAGRTARITVKDEAVLDVQYLFHYMNSPAFIARLHRLSTGTIQSDLSLRDLRKAPVAVPPVKEQQRIAALFSAYHGLLENNETRNGVIREIQCLLATMTLPQADCNEIHRPAT